MKRFQQIFWLSWSHLGTIVAFAFTALLLLVFGELFEALLFAWLLLTTTVVVYAIKWLHPSKRPDYKKKVKKVKYFWQKVDLSSFPSAHAARAAAFVVIALLALPLWLVLFSLVFFALTCYARIILKRHYWRDLAWGSVFGAILGWASWFLTTITFDIFDSLLKLVF